MKSIEEIEYELEENVCEIFSEGLKYFHQKDYAHATKLLATSKEIYLYLENSKMINLTNNLLDLIEFDEEEKRVWRTIGKQKGNFFLNIAIRGREFLEEINHGY